MQHRDKIIIQKILSEIDIGIGMMGKEKLDAFDGSDKTQFRRDGIRLSQKAGTKPGKQR